MRIRLSPHPSRLKGISLVVGGLVSLSLCACGLGNTGQRTQSNLAISGDVSGTWEGAFERELATEAAAPADRETQRHTWRLRQVGNQVRGVVFIEVTLVSGDGRPYLCSGRTSLTAWLTSEVEGKREGSRLVLSEKGKPRIDGPCQPPPRQPTRFEGRLHGDTIALLGDEGRRQLVRRQSAANRAAATTAELAIIAPQTTFALVAPGPALSMPGALAALQGHWVWEQQNQLPNGDGKREREEWHLVQEGPEVVGFYDRVVEHRSNDGRLYRCNGAISFRTVTRYEVHGVVAGPQFLMSEQSFEVIEGSPCDDGKRQLDSYQGEVRESQIVLKLGLGQQVLRKARPSVPTQSL